MIAGQGTKIRHAVQQGQETNKQKIKKRIKKKKKEAEERCPDWTQSARPPNSSALAAPSR